MDLESNVGEKSSNVHWTDEEPLADTGSERLGSSDGSYRNAQSSPSGDYGADGLNLYYEDDGALGGSGKGKNGNDRYEGTTKRLARRRRKFRLALLAFLLFVVIVGIVVGIAISRNNENPDESQSKNNVTDASGSIDNENKTDVPSDRNQTEAPENEDGGDDDNHFMPYLDDTEGVVIFTSDVGPFTVEIPTLASRDISTYEDASQVNDGLSRMALFLLNNVVNRINGKSGFGNVGHGGGVGSNSSQDGDDHDEFKPPPADMHNNETTINIRLLPDLESVEFNDYEKPLAHADVAKSDGTFIYAAYGNRLLIVRADSEELVLKLELPPSQCPPAEDAANDTTVPIDEADDSVEDAKNDTHTNGEGHSQYVDCPTPWIESILLGDSRLVLIVSGHGQVMLRGNNTEVPVLSELLSTHIRLYSTEALLQSNGGLSLLGTENVNGRYREGFVMKETGVAHIVTFSLLNTRAWLVNPIEHLRSENRNLTTKEFNHAIRDEGPLIVGSFVNQTLSELSMTTGELPRIARLMLPIDKASDVEGFENVLFAEGYVNAMVQITSLSMNPERRRLMPSSDETLEKIELEQNVQFLPSAWAEVYATEEMIVAAGQGYDFDSVRRTSEGMTIFYAFNLNGTLVSPLANGWVPGSLLNRYSMALVDGYFRIATATRSMAVDDLFDVQDEASEPPSQSGHNFVFIANCPSLEAIDDEECFNNETRHSCTELRDRDCAKIVYWNGTCPNELRCLDDFNGTQCPMPSPGGDNACLTEGNVRECLQLEESGCKKIVSAEGCPLQFQCVGEEAECIPNDHECIEQDEDEGHSSDTRSNETTTTRIFVLRLPEEDSNSSRIEILGNTTLGKPNEGNYLINSPFWPIKDANAHSPFRSLSS
jgi:Beta propeller domain